MKLLQALDLISLTVIVEDSLFVRSEIKLYRVHCLPSEKLVVHLILLWL